ncbi:hypothetical protein ACFP1I_15630 [Dyadobacter subterraneus]|uniref:Uncharacterized protein n=1 Tax=Dyadobacter subterraneus TaxID=2773304 RepID=A0ABR9WIJ5_9BACT|nr:hypothetical protein [Dyadobacter subterraneus]MBE9465213.1 hypothetical protein [Dyadobacter subterraneus]
MSSAALFQILYQNETLFQLQEDVVVRLEEKEVVPEIIPAKIEVPAATPVREIIPQPVVKVNIETTKPVAPIVQFPVLNHKVLILIDEPKQKEMLVSEALFLDNILKAVGQSSENSDILNFSFLSGPDARNVLAEKRINYFITFGVPLIKLRLDLLLPPYTPKQVEGIWFLLTDPLAVIEADVVLKKKLWTALKQMFPKT